MNPWCAGVFARIRRSGLPVVSPSYRHLHRLRASASGAQAVVIGRDALPLAAAAALRHGLQEPSAAGNRLLLAACDQGDDAAFLCLRCLVSEPLEQKLRSIHRERGRSHQLDLVTLASFALDDSGELLPYTPLQVQPEATVRPFTAQVICSFDRQRGADLPHWARTKLQACPDLKRYLRQHGVLLISPWALLADSSPKRLREALELFGAAGFSMESALALHAAYREAYGPAKAAYLQRSGKQSGWLPDAAFLQQIAPEQGVERTAAQLAAMDQAIRRLLTGSGQLSLEQQAEQGYESVDTRALEARREADERQEDGERIAAIRAALERALEPHVRALIEADRPRWLKAPERRQAWQLYGEGASQRTIAEAMDKGQGWVSKLLQEKQLSGAIALAAGLELKRLPAFAAVGSSVEGAERLVAALRNHLITPEREGMVSPLRRAVAAVLAALTP